MEVKHKVFERIKGGITIGLGVWLLLGVLASVDSASDLGKMLISAIGGNQLDMLYVLIIGSVVCLVIVFPAVCLFILNLVQGIIMLAAGNRKLLKGVAIVYAIFMGIVSVILLWFYIQGMDVAVQENMDHVKILLNLFFHPFLDVLFFIWGIVSCIITCLNCKK